MLKRSYTGLKHVPMPTVTVSNHSEPAPNPNIEPPFGVQPTSLLDASVCRPLQEVETGVSVEGAWMVAKRLAAWARKAGGTPPVALVAAVNAVAVSHSSAIAKLHALGKSSPSSSGSSTSSSDSSSSSSTSSGTSSDSSDSSGGDSPGFSSSGSDSESSGAVRWSPGRGTKQDKLDSQEANNQLVHLHVLSRLSILLQRSDKCAPLLPFVCHLGYLNIVEVYIAKVANIVV